MAQTSEKINSSDQKIHPYYQTRKMIVNLGSNKFENNDTSSCQLNHLHNLLLMSVYEIPENNLSNVDRKSDIRKVHTSSVKSSSILFSCSIRAMYNRVNFDQKQRLVLKSYLPGIDT